GEWAGEQTTTFKLFADRAILPGDTINLNAASIKKGAGSIDFFARIRIDYKFYNSSNEDVTASILDYSVFMTTPEFNSAWVDGNAGDGWFYYASGTNLNALPASYVNIFAGTPAINIALNAEGFNHQGGGYKYSSSITITKVEAVLTLEAIQIAGSTWGIYVPEVVENSNSQVVEILQNTITLGDVGGAYKLGTGEAGSLDYDATNLGNTLKIVVAGDSQINANAFENSDLENVYIGDADYIAGVSSYSAKIYTTPATFIIGANAFRGCTNLNVYLSSSCNYQIYISSLAGVGNVYLDGVLTNGLKNPSVGAYNAYITVLENPSIVTGGSGAGAVNNSSNTDYGAYTYTDANGNIWYFDLINNNTQVEIKKCLTSLGEDPTGALTIPSQVSSSELAGNISVTRIGMSAFCYCTGLTSITIPNTVTYIDYNPFWGCSGLISFSGGNVNDISISADGRCLIRNFIRRYQIGLGPEMEESVSELIAFAPSGLTSYSIPNTVTSIGYRTFQDFANLTSITIPSSVTNIESNAFCSCTGLTSITIPSSVKQIGMDAFFGCSGLQSITIPNSVTGIYENAFSNCTGLTSIEIPSSVIYIGSYAFSWCTNLQSVTFEGGGTRNSLYVDFNAFANNESLAEVNFTGDWTGITVTVDEDAFAYCDNLFGLEIPNQ
ncbi:MAG: leucine-rich repeat domain-containing protein, partial [Clostridia bacterium]|nr:leucine-rich repeat domain-containing protein [Clostridia bacterium]